MNNSVELDLLSEEEIYGLDGTIQLNIFKNMPEGELSSTNMTDLAIIFGASCAPSKKGYVGEIWTKSRRNESMIGVYDYLGHESACMDYRRYPAIRPVIRNNELFDELYKNAKKNEDGFEEVIYGEYPQSAVNEELFNKLENEYNAKNLTTTGANYTFDRLTEDIVNRKYMDGFEPMQFYEYEYEGKKYVRVKRTSNLFGRTLSNGMNKFDKDYFWFEVTPVKWLVDKKTKTLIAKNSLLSGVAFGLEREYKDSYLKKYLDNYMLHDLVQHYNPELLQEQKLESARNKYTGLSRLFNIFKKEKIVNKVSPEGVKEIEKRHLRLN